MFSIPDGLEWVDVKDKWNFRAGCIHCGYMYIQVRVPSKKKTWEMPGIDIYTSGYQKVCRQSL